MSLTCWLYPANVEGNFDGIDYSNSLISAEWTTDVRDNQPGKLVVETTADSVYRPQEGYRMYLYMDNQKVFQGRLFTREKTGSNKHWSLTSYDQLRYLQNEDTKVFQAARAGDIFATICQENELSYRVIDAGNYWCPASIQDKKTYFSMIQNAMDLTLINAAQWLVMQDVAGTLQLVDVNRLVTNLMIGDESLATDFTYKSSIDDETYNQIKLTQDNTDTNKREVYIVKDSNKISAWGKLQYFESVDEKLNPQQIAEKANMLMKALGDARKDFTIEALGDLRVRAGSGIYVQFKDLASEGYNKLTRCLVVKCTHSWKGETHTMSLTLRVV